VELEWVAFDLNGTLLDPGDLDAALDEAILLSMAETLSGGYRPLPELLEAALVRRAGGRQDGIDEALRRASRMPAYPDASAALGRLQTAGLGTAVLTNSATDQAKQALRGAGLEVELTVGSDQVRAFKPDPRVYNRWLQAAGVAPQRACMVSAHAWDLMGAARVGMRTAWVSQRERLLLETVPEPDVRAESLEQAAAGISRLAGAAHV